MSLLDNGNTFADNNNSVITDEFQMKTVHK